MRCAVLLVGLGTVLMGCARGPDKATVQPPVPAEAAESNSATLAILQTRDRRLAIVSTSAGPRFTLSTRDGQVLGRNLTLDQLEVHDPQLHETIRTGVARGRFLDAKVYDEARPPAQPGSSQRDRRRNW